MPCQHVFAHAACNAARAVLDLQHVRSRVHRCHVGWQQCDSGIELDVETPRFLLLCLAPFLPGRVSTRRRTLHAHSPLDVAHQAHTVWSTTGTTSMVQCGSQRLETKHKQHEQHHHAWTGLCSTHTSVPITAQVPKNKLCSVHHWCTWCCNCLAKIYRSAAAAWSLARV